MDQSLDLLSKEELQNRVEILEAKLKKEQIARRTIEKLLDHKSSELFERNQELIDLNQNLERRVLQRANILTSLISSLNQGVLVEDENRKILLTNSTFRSLFSIEASAADLIGADCASAAEAVSALFENPVEFVKSNNANFKSDEPVIGEVLKLKDGRVFERDSIPVSYNKTRHAHLWAYRDVTQEFNFQKRLRESEEKYRGIIENMELGLLEVDLNHKILKAYDWFCDMTGYTEDELIGKNAIELLLPEKYWGLMTRQDEKRSEGAQSIYEVELIKKNGETIWALISGAPFYNPQGKIIGSIGIHYDITHKKKLESDLQKARSQAEKLREAEKQFLAKMSHEIRNPINAIIGLTSLLYDTKPTTDQKAHLDNIKYSADILLGLISEILDIAKIESGQLHLAEKELNIHDTVKALLQIIDFKRSGKDLRFQMDIDEKIDFNVLADPTVINQIFLNLLGNAEKFTERGFIRVSVLLISNEKDHCTILCQVEDSGIGIDESEVDNIFNSFQQANSETKLKYGGTGLGLSIVRQLVGRYDGDIKVESELGEGTTFSFDLRLKKAAVRTEVERVLSYENRSDGRLLIVEDNKINQQYLSGLLRKWGIYYDIASDGLEALKFLDREVYDLILMDIRMPGMDGYETTIRLRAMKTNENCDIPIIALTASALVDEKERALAAGMNHHMTKPFTPDQLAVSLKNFDILTEKHDSEECEEAPEFFFSEELDGQHLNEFYEGDLARAKMMFGIFLRTIDNEIKKMRLYIENEDWQLVKSVAHKIKPNFAMVGLVSLSEKMSEYELVVNSEQIRNKIAKDFEVTFDIFEKKKQIVTKQLEKIEKFLKNEMHNS